MSAQPKPVSGPFDSSLTKVLDVTGMQADTFTYPEDILDPEVFYGSIVSGVGANPADRLRLFRERRSIGIHFSRFTEGRPYSLASRLRELGYLGEIHALGEVHEELVHHMIRVGFTHFHLDRNPVGIHPSILRPFSFAYQQTARRVGDVIHRAN